MCLVGIIQTMTNQAAQKMKTTLSLESFGDTILQQEHGIKWVQMAICQENLHPCHVSIVGEREFSVHVSMNTA